MTGVSGGAIDTGGGGLDAGSSASGDSGDIRSGDRAHGGINLGNSSAFQLNATTIAIGLFTIAAFLYAKRKGFI